MISILVTPKVKRRKAIGHVLRAYIVGCEHPLTTHVSKHHEKYRFYVFDRLYEADTIEGAIERFGEIAMPILILAAANHETTDYKIES